MAGRLPGNMTDRIPSNPAPNHIEDSSMPGGLEGGRLGSSPLRGSSIPSTPPQHEQMQLSPRTELAERMHSDSQFMNKATEESTMLIAQLESSINRLSNLGAGMAGSIGVALAGTQVTGLMPFGPAFQCGQLSVGDEIVSVDGVDMNDESVVGAVAGEQDTDIELFVRKTTGGVTTLNLVRTSSAKLLIAHNLAQNLHAIFQRCSEGAVEMTCLDDGEVPGRRSLNHELAPMTAGCVALLQELQEQLSRSETFIRARLKDVQSNMFLQLKQLQEQEQRFLQRYIMSMRTFAESFEAQITQARDAKDKAEEERTHLLEQLGASDRVLNDLQSQIQYQHVTNKSRGTEGSPEGTQPPMRDANSFDEREWLSERVQDLQSRVDNLEAEKRIFQEMLHVDNPESIKQTLRAQNLIVQQLKEELNTSREHLTSKVGEVEQLKKSLAEAEKEVQQYSQLCNDQDSAANESRQTREKLIKDLEDSRTYSRALQDEVQRLAALSSTLQEHREKEGEKQPSVQVLAELTDLREKVSVFEKESEKLNSTIAAQQQRVLGLETEAEKLNSTINALQQRLVQSAQECQMLRVEKDQAQAGLEKCKAELEDLKNAYQVASEGWDGAKRELKESMISDKRIILHKEPVQQATGAGFTPSSPPIAPGSTGSFATVRTEYSAPNSGPAPEIREDPPTQPSTLVSVTRPQPPAPQPPRGSSPQHPSPQLHGGSSPLAPSPQTPGGSGILQNSPLQNPRGSPNSTAEPAPSARKAPGPYTGPSSAPRSQAQAPNSQPLSTTRSLSPPPQGVPAALGYSPSPWAPPSIQYGTPQPMAGPIITKVVTKEGAVYSSNNTVMGQRQATSLPGSRSTSPAVPARSVSPMTPRATVLYSSLEQFPQTAYSPMSPGPQFMPMVPTYVHHQPVMSMGQPMPRNLPVSARDRTAAWVQTMQFQPPPR